MSDLEELNRKYDKLTEFLGKQNSVLDNVIKHLDNVDRRLKKIEDKFA